MCCQCRWALHFAAASCTVDKRDQQEKTHSGVETGKHELFFGWLSSERSLFISRLFLEPLNGDSKHGADGFTCRQRPSLLFHFVFGGRLFSQGDDTFFLDR